MYARFAQKGVTGETGGREEQLGRLRRALETADAVVIGAGAGLSAAAGMTYSGERFYRYFRDFAGKYRFRDMYAGGFNAFDTPEEHWAYWSRFIYINRYMDAPRPVYRELLELVRDKDYFVLTTNVDHQFQKAGFDKERLFYTQGDYGLWQCGVPCHDETYDNEDAVRRMVAAQGFSFGEQGELCVPEGTELQMEVPSELLPRCPRCRRPMAMNLRADDTFVEDEGWRRACGRYGAFLQSHQSQKTLFLELAVGYNTPAIVKYPFWRMTRSWEAATYACVNNGEACAPEAIRGRSICINGDAGDVLTALRTGR